MRGNLSAEINEMAQGLVDFGKRCADAGRDWLSERRNEMNRDPQGRPYQGRERGQQRWSGREDEGRVYYGGPDTPREGSGERGTQRHSSYGAGPESWREDRSGGFAPRSGHEQSGYERGYGGPAGYGAQSQDSSQRDFGRGYGGSDYRDEAYGGYGRNEPYRSQASGMPTWESPRSMDPREAAQRSYGDYAREGYDRREAYGERGQQYGTYGTNRGQGSEALYGFRGRGPKNYSRSDERIREDVCERLLDADDIDASNVSVTVNQGVVTLDGEVPHRGMKHSAEDLVECCGGVRDVENRLRVQSQSRFSPTGTEQRAQGQQSQGQQYGQTSQSRTTGTATGTKEHGTESPRH